MIFTEFLLNWILNIFYIMVVAMPLILMVRALLVSMGTIKEKIELNP